MALKVQLSSTTALNAPQPWKPHGYQKRAVRFLVEHAAAGLILDPGMGKTSITLAALVICQKTDPDEKMLVIAPRRPARLVWPAEVEKWADFTHLRVEVLHGDKKEEALERDADIYTINPEGLPWLLADKGRRLKALIKRGVKILTVDESTKFKRTTTKRFKLLKPFLPLFRRRWILTGTPAPKGYLDLFGQVYVMDLGKALGQYITHYRNEFFYPTGFGGYTWKLQDGADKKINARLKPSIMSMSADDYLELPEQVVNPIWVELSPEARKIYDAMEEDLVALLESAKVVTAATAATASMKCCQVANGAIYLDVEPGCKPRPGERWAEIHDAKIEALLDLIEDLQGKPLLIAYEFNHDLERLVAALGPDAPVMGISDKRDAVIEKAWNAGELDYVLGHPASIGHGLNLQYGGCEDVCWFSTTWDFELYDQFNKRVRRQGNKARRVRIHHILARDTVDEDKLRDKRTKDMTQRGFLEAVKARRGATSKNRATAKICALQPSKGGVKDSSSRGATVAAQVQEAEAMMPKTREEYEKQVIGGAVCFRVKTPKGAGQADNREFTTFAEAKKYAEETFGPGKRQSLLYVADAEGRGALIDRKDWGFYAQVFNTAQGAKQENKDMTEKTAAKASKIAKPAAAKAAKDAAEKPAKGKTPATGKITDKPEPEKAKTAVKVGVGKKGVQTEGAAPETAAEKPAKGTRATKADVKAAAEAAKKATPPAREKAPRSGKYDEKAKLTVLVKENPKREGSKAYDKFERYFKAKTVGAFFEMGGTSANLDWDVDHGYIKVG